MTLKIHHYFFRRDWSKWHNHPLLYDVNLLNVHTALGGWPKWHNHGDEHGYEQGRL